MLYTLSHTIHDCKIINARVFGTLTLLPRHYRKKVEKQQKEMDKIIGVMNRLMLLDRIKGTYELTTRGVVHAHFIASIRDHALPPDVNPEVFVIKALYVNMSHFGRCDFQIIKDIEKVENYLVKEISLTGKFLKYVYFSTVPENNKPNKVFEEIVKSEKEFDSSVLDEGIEASVKVNCLCCDDNDINCKIK